MTPEAELKRATGIGARVAQVFATGSYSHVCDCATPPPIPPAM